MISIVTLAAFLLQLFHVVLSLVNIQVAPFHIFIITLITLLHGASFQMNFIHVLLDPGRNFVGKIAVRTPVSYPLPWMCFTYMIKHILICRSFMVTIITILSLPISKIRSALWFRYFFGRLSDRFGQWPVLGSWRLSPWKCFLNWLCAERQTWVVHVLGVFWNKSKSVSPDCWYFRTPLISTTRKLILF